MLNGYRFDNSMVITWLYLKNFLVKKRKDKILLNDPTIAGSGLKMFIIMYKKMGAQYIEDCDQDTRS